MPTRRHRRWHIQIRFLNPRTYPVGKLHRYFEGSYVPGRRGVSHTPHPAAPKRMKTGWFFEGPHVPDCRDVLHTPHRRPRRGRKRDSFSKNHAYPVGALHQYFEGSHVPSCRGVSNTPHQTPLTVAYTDPFFEPSHVPGCRGVSNTPHHTPLTVAYTDPFFEPSHIPSWRIASVFRRITRAQL